MHIHPVIFICLWLAVLSGVGYVVYYVGQPDVLKKDKEKE